MPHDAEDCLERKVAHGLLRQARTSHVNWAEADEKWLEARTKRRVAAGDREFHTRWVDFYDFIIAALVDGDYD